MRPLKDRAGTDREVDLAGVAAVESDTGARCDPITCFASRARGTVRPQATFQVLPRGLFVREEFKQLEGAYGGLAHEPIILESLTERKLKKGLMYIIPQKMSRSCGAAQFVSLRGTAHMGGTESDYNRTQREGKNQ